MNPGVENCPALFRGAPDCSGELDCAVVYRDFNKSIIDVNIPAQGLLDLALNFRVGPSLVGPDFDVIGEVADTSDSLGYESREVFLSPGVHLAGKCYDAFMPSPKGILKGHRLPTGATDCAVNVHTFATILISWVESAGSGVLSSLDRRAWSE